MARIRSVKPSLRTSRVVASWPMEVRYFWVLLWGYLDDKGRGLDLPRAIASDCFPIDDIPASKVDRWMTLMATTKVGSKDPPLCRYEVDGDRYIHSVNFAEHQKPNRPTPSMLPPCPLHDSLTASLSESPLLTHMLEGEIGDRRGRGEGDSVSWAPRPSSTCSKHVDGTDTPCHTCRKARQAAEAWDIAQTYAVAERARGPKCPKHPGQRADRCSGCAADAKARPTEETPQ